MAGVGAAPWQSPSGIGLSASRCACAISLGRTSLKSFRKEHFRISKINVQGESLSCFWVKQNEDEKSLKLTSVYLAKCIKHCW